jgi:archaellum component FlaF (FlaF/FlaG flagellin family)
MCNTNLGQILLSTLVFRWFFFVNFFSSFKEISPYLSLTSEEPCVTCRSAVNQRLFQVFSFQQHFPFLACFSVIEKKNIQSKYTTVSINVVLRGVNTIVNSKTEITLNTIYVTAPKCDASWDTVGEKMAPSRVLLLRINTIVHSASGIFILYMHVYKKGITIYIMIMILNICRLRLLTDFQDHLF